LPRLPLFRGAKRDYENARRQRRLPACITDVIECKVACVEFVMGDVDLILAEEARAEAELLAASKRDAARLAERVPAYRRCA
jgi:hypothetical protein